MNLEYHEGYVERKPRPSRWIAEWVGAFKSAVVDVVYIKNQGFLSSTVAKRKSVTEDDLLAHITPSRQNHRHQNR